MFTDSSNRIKDKLFEEPNISCMQAICDNYDLKIENLASLVNGKSMWCFFVRTVAFVAFNKVSCTISLPTIDLLHHKGYGS